MRTLTGKLAAFAAVIAVATWWHIRTPEPTVLSFRIAQTFEDVVRKSTYPVIANSVVPANTFLQSGETFVTAPAVILRFDDAKHGFVLPPTKFAVLSFNHNHVSTLATSPMLKKLPFDEAVAILENLQNQFKKGEWEPWRADGSEWFDLSPEGKKKLYIRMFQPGYMQTISLRIPKKYGMTFRLKCAEGCWTREPPYTFLIDVGVGSDTAGWEPVDPMVWEKSHPAHESGTGQVETRR